MTDKSNVVIAEEEEEQLYYFYFSKEQQDSLEDHASTYGGRVIHGEVLHEGSMRIYTEKSTSDDSRFSDAILITKGYLSDLNYSERSITGTDGKR